MKRITRVSKQREPVALSTNELVQITGGVTSQAPETRHYTVKLTNATIASIS